MKNKISKEDFYKLSVYEQRVFICQDVVDRLNEGSFISVPGVFIRGGDLLNISDPKKQQEYVNNKTCEVCAKAGLFLSYIGNFNTFNVKGVYENTKSMPEEFVNIFSKNLLDIIEQIFEDCGLDWNESTISKQNYQSFFDQIDQIVDSDDVLFNILDNIIKNKGILVLDDGSKIG